MANVRKNGEAAKERGGVDLKTFMKIWIEEVNSEGSIANVAKRTNMAEASVSQKVSVLRNKHKVPLPEFPRGGGGGARFNRNEALGIMAELMGEDVDTLDKQGKEYAESVAAKRAEREAAEKAKAETAEG